MQGISGLGVTGDKGHLVDVLSVRDLRGLGVKAEHFERLWLSVRRYKEEVRKEFRRQTPPVPIHVTEDDSFERVISAMDDGNIHRVFVVRKEEGGLKPTRVITQRTSCASCSSRWAWSPFGRWSPCREEEGICWLEMPEEASALGLAGEPMVLFICGWQANALRECRRNFRLYIQSAHTGEGSGDDASMRLRWRPMPALKSLILLDTGATCELGSSSDQSGSTAPALAPPTAQSQQPSPWRSATGITTTSSSLMLHHYKHRSLPLFPCQRSRLSSDAPHTTSHASPALPPLAHRCPTTSAWATWAATTTRNRSLLSHLPSGVRSSSLTATWQRPW